MQNPRTRLVGCVFATIILLSIGLPASGQENQSAPTISQDLTKALEQMHEMELTIDTRRSTAPQEVIKRLDRIPPLPKLETAKPPNITLEEFPQPLGEADRTKLLDAIKDFSSHTDGEDRLFTLWAIIFISASAVFALAGGILSFLRKNVWGGVLGLVVTALIAFSNAYPFNALSTFYGWLHSKAEALRIECQLKEPFTTNVYAAEAQQLKLLMEAEADRPRLGNYKAPIQGVTENVEKVKVAANTIERETAIAQGQGGYISVKNRPSAHLMEKEPTPQGRAGVEKIGAKRPKAKQPQS